MLASLSPRQNQVLDCIVNFRQKNGVSPTLQQISDEVEISRSAALEHIRAMREKGILRPASGGRVKRDWVPTAEQVVDLAGALEAVDRTFRGKRPSDRIGDSPERLKRGLVRLPTKYQKN